MNPFDHWWWQRGPLLTCGYGTAAPLCVADNLAHYVYRSRLALRRATGWRAMCPTVPHRCGLICRAHNRAVERAAFRRHPEFFEEDDRP